MAARNGPKPRLVVFDLDRTLWPFWVDTHVDPPFTRHRKGERPESVSPKKANPKAVPKVEALEVEDDDGFISASQQNRSSRKHAMRGETSKERVYRNEVLYDRYGKKVTHFPDVPDILERLTNAGIPIAAASRTGEIDGAEQLLELWGWNRYFSYKEIYPGCKVTHFNKFKKNSGVPFKDMLFFDDEYRNIEDISKLGVTCIFAKDGMSMQVLEEGFQKFAREHRN